MAELRFEVEKWRRPIFRIRRKRQEEKTKIDRFVQMQARRVLT